jgi:hypothetical protein
MAQAVSQHTVDVAVTENVRAPLEVRCGPDCACIFHIGAIAQEQGGRIHVLITSTESWPGDDLRVDRYSVYTDSNDLMKRIERVMSEMHCNGC